MRKIRVYVGEDWSGRADFPFPCALEGTDVHHLWDVLRLQAGDSVVMYDRGGCEYRAELSEKRGSVIVLQAKVGPANVLHHHITVALVAPRAGRMDDMIRPLSELGAHAVQPMVSEFGIDQSGSLSEDKWKKRLERWQRLAKESAKQCGRAQTMEVLAPVLFSQALDQSQGADLRLILDPFGDERPSWPRRPSKDAPATLFLFIGPEGGFSLQEQERARQAGCVAWRISPHVLRCETAGLSALAVVQFMLNYGA